MATVNCPFCGKENPEDNQSCWFCQALLKPQENADAGADDVSWLRALSGQPDSQPQPASEPGIPPDDWLADLRAARPDETTPAPDTFGEGDTPDQLVGQQDFPPSDGENGAVIERLESLGIEPRPAQNEIQDLPAASQPPATDETAERSDDLVESGTDLTDDNMPETGLPDWLAELQRTRSDTPAQPSVDSPFVENGAVQPPPDQDIPVFSSDLSDLDSEETPDWLAGLMAEQPAPQQPPTAEPFPSDELPSFETPAEEPDAATPALPEETPDWLAGLMAEQPAPQQPPTAEPFPSDELPSFETPAEEPGAATPALPEETPDWLAGLMIQQPAPQQPPTAEPFPSDELPSFETPAEEPGAAAPALPEETPDWLADLQATFASDATQPEPSSPPPPQPGDHIAEESLPSAETGDAPDWLASLPPAGPAADQPTSEPDADSADDILEWSPGESEFYSPPNEPEDGSSGAGVFTYDTGEAPAANGTIAPFTGEDLPDWLSLIPIPGNAQATTGETAGAESLSPAEIPTWLEAMRPVTSLTPDETPPSEGEDAIQPSGPLAGLRGILTSATAATQYRTPPAYSAHLQVSERQQKQAGLLEDALTSEKQAVTAAEAARRSSQRWVRVVMGLILIAALLGTLLFTSSGTPPASAGDPSRVLPFHQVISSLAPGSAVLLAVDYNAGYAGEMRFSAGYVVQELIVRQSRLVWVSTLPTGPILAQSLQQTALDELAIRYGQPDLGYLVADKTANLGYLAGGVTSLQEFASQPQQAVRYGLEGALDGTSVWSRPALDGIQRVSDFAAVIVITDDAGTARAWVEQVEPALADTPLLLVVSAQAAPMAIPYLESAQVDAILSGMGDGMAYERLTSVKASGNNFWRAYQVGILVIMLFTLLGVVLQLSLKPNARSKPKRKAG